MSEQTANFILILLSFKVVLSFVTVCINVASAIKKRDARYEEMQRRHDEMRERAEQRIEKARKGMIE